MSDPARLRVFLLIKGLGVGGAERLLERSIPYFDRTQFDYQIGYLLPWKNALVPSFELAGIPVHCFNSRRVIDVGVLHRLTSVLRSEQIELVHAHLPIPGVLARFTKRLARVRWLVYTEHNVPSRYGAMTRVMNATTYRFNDAVVAVSREVESRIRTYVRGGRPRVVTIPNAVDPEMFGEKVPTHEEICRQFGFPPDALIVVNVANLVWKKGHRYLLAAARRVVDQEPRARFLLVGLGPLGPELAREARQYGLNGHVVFTGFRADAMTLMAAADLFVLASVHEGLPVSLLEAMALGKPAVVTRVGGIPEVVLPGQTAALVEPMDVSGLTTAILSLLHDSARRARMGEMARQHIRERYGMAQMVKAVEDVYREVAGR